MQVGPPLPSGSGGHEDYLLQATTVTQHPCIQSSGAKLEPLLVAMICIDAELVSEAAGGKMYVAFEGFLGKGAMQRIYAIGTDVWIMPNERAMDSSAPGDWTIVFDRDSHGKVTQAHRLPARSKNSLQKMFDGPLSSMRNRL